MKHIYKFTLPTHVLGIGSAVAAAMWGQWQFFAFAFVIWCLLSIGIEVGAHRLFSHHAFKTKRWIEVLLMYLATIAGQGSILFWVAVHKGYHHPFADSKEDPHSPVNGFWRAYVGWLFDDTQKNISLRASMRLMKDKTQMFFHTHYYKVIMLTIVGLFLINPWLVGAYLLASTIAIQQNFIVNVACHTPALGYQTYWTRSLATNIRWLTWLSWGLSLHNNHHFSPGGYNLAHDDKEFDPSAPIIRWIGTNLREY